MGSTGILIQGVDKLFGFGQDSNVGQYFRPAAVNGTVVTWYLESLEGYSNVSEDLKAKAQLNTQNCLYRWFAIG